MSGRGWHKIYPLIQLHGWYPNHQHRLICALAEELLVMVAGLSLPSCLFALHFAISFTVAYGLWQKLFVAYRSNAWCSAVWASWAKLLWLLGSLRWEGLVAAVALASAVVVALTLKSQTCTGTRPCPSTLIAAGSLHECLTTTAANQILGANVS